MKKEIENKNGEMVEIPLMDGAKVNERLANLVAWRDENLRMGQTMTLQQIGDGANCTRELVRQIEASALKKCRQNYNKNKLKR